MQKDSVQRVTSHKTPSSQALPSITVTPPKKVSTPPPNSTPASKDHSSPETHNTPTDLKTSPSTSTPSSHTTRTNTPTSTFSYRQLLDALKQEAVIVVALKNASFGVDHETLTLRLSSKWHHDKLSETKHTNTLQETLSKLFGGEWKVRIELVPNTHAPLIDDVFI